MFPFLLDFCIFSLQAEQPIIIKTKFLHLRGKSLFCLVKMLVTINLPTKAFLNVPVEVVYKPLRAVIRFFLVL